MVGISNVPSGQRYLRKITKGTVEAVLAIGFVAFAGFWAGIWIVLENVIPHLGLQMWLLAAMFASGIVFTAMVVVVISIWLDRWEDK